jgi:hypothetical protein
MARALETFLTVLYIIVDDLYQHHFQPARCLPGCDRSTPKRLRRLWSTLSALCRIHLTSLG